MKKCLFVATILMASMLSSCDNGEETQELKDPSTVHPPSEAIPDSTKLVNDSLIMPDTVPGNGSQVGNNDSIQRQKR